MEPWRLDPYQKKFVRDFGRNRVVNKAKKVGMSSIIAGEALHKIFTKPGKNVIFVSTGQRVAGELLGKFYDEFDTLPQAIKPKLLRRSVQECKLINASRVISLPSHNPANIRGYGLRGATTDVYIDEHAHVTEDRELWIVVVDFQRIGGNITSISTPKGKRGKYYEIAEPLQALYREGMNWAKQDWSYHEIHYTECPRLRDQEKELKRDTIEIEFLQEYCNEFIDESVSFFPYELIWKAQKVSTLISGGYKTDNPIWMGIDFGKKVSETVIMVVEEYEPERYRVIWIEVLPGVNYPDQVDIIKQLDAIFQPSAIKVDATGPGGQEMVDFLNKEEFYVGKVTGYNLMATFKEKIIIRLRVLLERGRLDIPTKECAYGEKLESQLHSIQRIATQSGEHTRYSGKESGMDDMVWALALAVYKEHEISFDPYFKQVKDSVLEKLTGEEEKAPWVVVKEWEA
jgi:phage FluMu gp28-like protein